MQKKYTFDDVWKMFAETDQKFKESERMLSETFAETRQMFKETDKKFAETDKKFHETDRYIKDLNQKYGGITNTLGDSAEEYFYNSFEKTKKFGNEYFDYAEPNIKGRDKQLVDEYDIVLYNGKSIGIIEVKYNAKSNS